MGRRAPSSLSVIRKLRLVVGEIERFDSDLAKQLRRAASSVSLNLAEGSGSQGRNRNARYFYALGSAREVRACVHVAVAWGYIDNVDAKMLDEIERIVATLIRLIV